MGVKLTNIKVKCTQCSKEFEMEMDMADVSWIFYKKQIILTDCKECDVFTPIDTQKLLQELQGK